MTTDAPGLREAAETIIERFGGSQMVYGHLPKSAQASVQLARHIIATHPSDGGEAISEEWLREIGWTARIRSITEIFTLYVRGNGVHLDLDVSIVRDGEIWRVAMSWWRDHFSKWPLPLTTRDDLRHLLAALGCESNGKVE